MKGEDLKALRKQAGLTQTQLAELLGMTQTYIGLMERGTAPIERRTELAIEGMLRVRIDVSYSGALKKWVVSLSKPGEQPVHREIHIIGAKLTVGEAEDRAKELLAEHPFARLVVRQ